MGEKNEFWFEKLDAWQESRTYAKYVYDIINRFPSYEQYALCDQIRRAVVSVPSNIAEGTSRTSVKEKVHFLEIAYGSLMEVFCQLTIAYDLGYISQEELAKARAQSYKITKLISGLRTSFEKINTP